MTAATIRGIPPRAAIDLNGPGARRPSLPGPFDEHELEELREGLDTLDEQARNSDLLDPISECIPASDATAEHAAAYINCGLARCPRPTTWFGWIIDLFLAPDRPRDHVVGANTAAALLATENPRCPHCQNPFSRTREVPPLDMEDGAPLETLRHLYEQEQRLQQRLQEVEEEERRYNEQRAIAKQLQHTYDQGMDLSLAWASPTTALSSSPGHEAGAELPPERLPVVFPKAHLFRNAATELTYVPEEDGDAEGTVWGHIDALLDTVETEISKALADDGDETSLATASPIDPTHYIGLLQAGTRNGIATLALPRAPARLAELRLLEGNLALLSGSSEQARDAFAEVVVVAGAQSEADGMEALETLALFGLGTARLLQGQPADAAHAFRAVVNRPGLNKTSLVTTWTERHLANLRVWMEHESEARIACLAGDSSVTLASRSCAPRPG